MNQQYWTDKGERSINARLHMGRMEQKYHEQISDSVKMSQIYSSTVNNDGYDTSYTTDVVSYTTDVVVEDMDTVSAIFAHGDSSVKTAVLNFASYKNPGGRFLDGSKAQEECLCHESTLYNVLSKFPEYYEWNKKNMNYGLYKDRAIYCRDIIFERGDLVQTVDVITCAAPNKRVAIDYCKVSEYDNHIALNSRIKFIMDIAYAEHVDILILGAFGCGVFRQSPTEVASIFAGLLPNYDSFSKVVFAVPKTVHSENYDAFKQQFI